MGVDAKVQDAEAAASDGLLHRSDFDLDLHPGIEQFGRDHHRCWPHIAEVLFEYGPTCFKVIPIREDVSHSDRVFEAATRLTQRLINILQALLGLLGYAFCNGHGLVVESCGARDENEWPLRHGTRVADLLFEDGSGADEFAIHSELRRSGSEVKFKPTAVVSCCQRQKA